MDSETSIEVLRDLVVDFRDARNWEQYHQPKDLAAGLSIEAAELLELFLWKNAGEVKALLAEPLWRARLEAELADVLFFVLYLSKACHVDLSSAVRSKLRANEAKYPIDKSYGSNKKYNEFD